jgi:eukaryotic-like serine/threonine-protein kinase
VSTSTAWVDRGALEASGARCELEVGRGVIRRCLVPTPADDGACGEGRRRQGLTSAFVLAMVDGSMDPSRRDDSRKLDRQVATDGQLTRKRVASGMHRMVGRVTWVALWTWIAFSFVDVFMIAVRYQATPIWQFVVMRLIESAIMYGVHRLSRRPEISEPVLESAYRVCSWSTALFIMVMAIHFGGLTSPYVHGLSIVMLIQSALFPKQIQMALRDAAPVALAYPVVMGGAVFVSPELRAAWQNPSELVTAGSHYIFVLTSGLLGATSSHLMWAAQRQLYQARKLGRYRLEAMLAQGGMSEVWLAWDGTLRRKVALKLLRSMDDLDEEDVQRFEREALASSKLSDPHTIRIFDFGSSDDGIYYIAMELLNGADLAELVVHYGPMPCARVVRFGVQTCRSLIEAHEAGIIHRDIKPANLFVTRAGDDHDFLKLLDFGIARLLPGAGEANLTQTGVAVARGTPAYMPPEVCRGEPADARSDIYSLGATIYFLLTGKPPFDGPSPNEVLVAHLLEQPVPPSTVRGGPIPEALEQVVLRCLEKDPDARFQSARELFDVLSSLLDETSWSPADAERFWTNEHAAKLEREAAPIKERSRRGTTQN